MVTFTDVLQKYRLRLANCLFYLSRLCLLTGPRSTIFSWNRENFTLKIFFSITLKSIFFSISLIFFSFLPILLFCFVITMLKPFYVCVCVCVRARARTCNLPIYCLISKVEMLSTFQGYFFALQKES